MSLKIHHGYMIENMSTDMFHKLCIKYSDKIKKAGLKLIVKRQAIIIANLIDKVALKDEKGFVTDVATKTYKGFNLDMNPLDTSYHCLKEKDRIIKEQGIRNVDYDFTCSLRFYFCEDKILCLLNTEQSEFFKIWNSLKGVHEYPYWNNSDRPSDLTEQEWEHRKEEWFAAFGNSWTPSNAGFEFNCDVELPVLSAEFLIPFIPKLEKRCLNKSKQIVIDQKASELINSDSEKSIYRHINEAFDWILTKEGKDSIKNKQNYLKTILKQSFTETDLLRSFQEYYLIK